MAAPSALGAIEYMAETAFAEDSSTFSTHRIPVTGAVDCSGLVHAKEDSARVEQYRQGGSQHILMGQSGSFTTKLWLAGHGTTTVGSPTLDAIETFLGYVLGNVALSASASTTLTGGTATVPVTTASGTFSAGSLCRIGTGGISADTRGNGQFHAIGTHSTTNLTLLTGMNAAPTNGDVLYPAAMIYPSETPSAGLNGTTPGLRFRLLTANLQYACHGCYPTAVTLSGLNSGQAPAIEIAWAVSRWTAVSATFPSAVTSNQYNPAPIAAGSLFVAAVGTATRAVKSYRDFSVTYTLGMEPLLGPGGVSIHQSVVGCRRTVDKIALSWTEDADAATATPVLQGYGTGTTSYHVLWTGSVTAGSAVGLYFPKVCVTNVPTQKMDGSINRLTIEAAAYTGGTTTNDLTASAMRLGMA
jgi:hypothetical protein